MTVHLPLDTAPQRARLSVRDFLTLADAGAFAGYVRTELIEGEIWVVNAVHSRHARTHSWMIVELGIALKEIRSPLALYTTPSTELTEDSLPEPDIAIAEPTDSRTLPGSAIRLAVEISDSTLSTDLGRKTRLYAAAAIPEYWVVDVEARVIHLMWSPAGDAYAERRTIPFGAVLESVTIDGLAVSTTSLP